MAPSPGTAATTNLGGSVRSALGDELGLTAVDEYTSSPTRRASWTDTYWRRALTTDIGIVAAAVSAGVALRFGAGDTAAGSGPIDYAVLSLLLGGGWLALLGIYGAYDRKEFGLGTSEFRRMIRATMTLFGGLAIASYLTQLTLDRGYLAITLPIGLVGLIAARSYWRHWLQQERRAGRLMANVLVLGTRAAAETLALQLNRNPSTGYQVTGLCLPQAEAALTNTLDAANQTAFPVVGDLDEIAAAIDRSNAVMVAVASPDALSPLALRRLSWDLEGTGVRLVIAPAIADLSGPRMQVRPVAGHPLMHVEEPRYRGPGLVVKIATDFALGAIGVLMLSPLFLVVGALIKLHDRGPVFFRQTRIGKGGKPFRMWKFRSMVHGADKMFSAVKTDAGQGGQTFYKSSKDPRITPIGRIIRATSIDELPQLFNVLSGQMSIVGPRPLVHGEGAEVEGFLERRRLVKPGLTGLWQVSGRSDLSPEERIRLDLYYIENWSLANDLSIIARTFTTVLARDGAY